MIKEKIYIFDTTLRDGAQTEGVDFSIEDKNKIASVLSDAQLTEFYEVAEELNLDALIEVHDKSEMDRALKLGFSLIGINNRDLKTFKVNLETTINLSKGLQDKIIVSESGIKTKEDVKKIMSSGTKTFLVGESFMRASDPGEELQKLFFSC